MDKTTKASSGLLKSLIYTVVAFAVPVLGYLVPGALSLIAVALVSSAFFAVADAVIEAEVVTLLIAFISI